MTTPRPSSQALVPRRSLSERLRPYWTDVAAFAGALVTAALAAVLLGSLHGCGGGVGGEGTGSFASGPISGFGSIVVNGVRFDDSAASVLDDDGLALNRSALALGTVVEVVGGSIATASDGTATATASRVQVTRALVGPVTAVNATAGRLVVLGQTVRTTATTVVDERISGGLAGLAVGQVIEVHGAYDASTLSWAASRIALAESGAIWRVRGPLQGLDATAKTFTIGNQTYSYAALASSSALTEGSVVQVTVQATTASGTWQVSKGEKGRSLPDSNTGAELNCVVSSVLSSTRFVASGVTVDTSAAQVVGTVSVGATVQVSGTMVSGVLVATRVEVEDEQLSRDFDLRGTIEQVSASDRWLLLRGTRVSFARSDLVLEKGTLADLVVGRAVRIKGVLSSDRTRLEATQIRFE